MPVRKWGHRKLLMIADHKPSKLTPSDFLSSFFMLSEIMACLAISLNKLPTLFLCPYFLTFSALFEKALLSIPNYLQLVVLRTLDLVSLLPSPYYWPLPLRLGQTSPFPPQFPLDEFFTTTCEEPGT